MKIWCIALLLLFGCDDVYYDQEIGSSGHGQIFSARGNEQRIREDIVGIWKFQSVEIRTDSGRTFKITDDCEKRYPNVDADNFNFDLYFGIDEQSVTQYFNCSDLMTLSRFRIIETRGSVYLSINISHQYDYQFTDAPYYISQTMTLKAVKPPQGISSAVWVFKKYYK